ncbi:MAG: hypothetical protein HC804_09600 [Anaerolineae bacterium]|nr:hypothetical protein [Anaerolineae bacterium]
MANGLQGPAELELQIPRDATMPLSIRGSDRLVVYDGVAAVHEGAVVMRGFRLGDGADQGITLEAPGYWGALLARRTIDKRWADSRISTDIWQVEDNNILAMSGQIRDNRQGQQIFLTTAETRFNAEDSYAIYYTMPTGQTIKK